jgi:hypothetical protein
VFQVTIHLHGWGMCLLGFGGASDAL